MTCVFESIWAPQLNDEMWVLWRVLPHYLYYAVKLYILSDGISDMCDTKSSDFCLNLAHCAGKLAKLGV